MISISIWPWHMWVCLKTGYPKFSGEIHHFLHIIWILKHHFWVKSTIFRNTQWFFFITGIRALWTSSTCKPHIFPWKSYFYISPNHDWRSFHISKKWGLRHKPQFGMVSQMICRFTMELSLVMFMIYLRVPHDVHGTCSDLLCLFIRGYPTSGPCSMAGYGSIPMEWYHSNSGMNRFRCWPG